MDLGIKNKVALVAASSRGLGKAIAFQLSREGAKVVVCSRNEERLFKTRDEITAETGGIVSAFVVDVRDKNQVRKMVEQAEKELGTRIDSGLPES